MLAAAQTASSGAVAVGVVIELLFIAVAYVVSALSYKRIAERTGTFPSWWAWVPILNLLLLLRICRRSGWEVILLLIPLVNFVYLIMLMVLLPMRINRSPAWAIGLLIPLVNLAVLPYLAFSEA